MRREDASRRFYAMALRVFADMCSVREPEEKQSAAHMLNELVVIKRLLMDPRYRRRDIRS
jgi:hypothetical protein